MMSAEFTGIRIEKEAERRSGFQGRRFDLIFMSRDRDRKECKNQLMETWWMAIAMDHSFMEISFPNAPGDYEYFLWLNFSCEAFIHV